MYFKIKDEGQKYSYKFIKIHVTIGEKKLSTVCEQKLIQKVFGRNRAFVKLVPEAASRSPGGPCTGRAGS
jgi:hypothetical protein